MSPMPLAGLCPGGRCPRRAEEWRPAAGPRRPAAERPLGAVRRQRPSAAVAATARGSWRCSNSLLKRREAREARERKARRVWAASLPPPPLDASEGPERCRHMWGDPVAVSFSCDSRDVIRVCEPCQGFVRRCKRCRRSPGLSGTGRRVLDALVVLRVVAEGARVHPQGFRRRAHTVRVDACWRGRLGPGPGQFQLTAGRPSGARNPRVRGHSRSQRPPLLLQGLVGHAIV